MQYIHKDIVTPKKGSIMVDAAICLPLFIIALAMLLQVINFAGKEERGYYDAYKMICAQGLVMDNADMGFDIRDDDKRVSIDNVLRMPITYKIDFPFAGAFLKSNIAVMDMPYRVYIGESPDLYEDDYVYIFPKNEGNEKEGPKYHSAYCRTMKAGATRGLEIEKVREDEAKSRGYSLCHWCSVDKNKN